MRLSVVFELLLVFLFLAFASARVIDPKNTVKNVTRVIKKTTAVRQGPPNRYCACTSRMCNCCRDFSLPVVPIKGPGCASIMYLQKDTMMVTMQFGDRVLSNTTISGKNPRPICMALPGGISQFCGRVYGISRKGDQFRACLGLELRALDDIEAALRVSCFKFGPKGVNLESAPPVPAESGNSNKEPDTDDDDDYDLEDDDDDFIGLDDDDDDGASNEDNEVDSDTVDYTGFSVLGEDILGSFFSDDTSSSNSKKKKVKKTAKPQTIILKASTTTRRPILPTRRRSTAKPDIITQRPINRITRPQNPTKKRPINLRPQTVVRPSSAGSAVASSQVLVHQGHIATAITPTVSTANSVKETVIKEPTMQTFVSVKETVIKEPTTQTFVPVKETVIKEPTTQTFVPVKDTITIMELHEKEKEHSTDSAKITAVTTEAPVTFTVTTNIAEMSSTNKDVKNDIKIPQMDLAKVEAVAAIAQQNVASGVISSSSKLTSEDTEKPEEVVTLKFEKISSFMTEHTTPFVPENTDKTNSVKYISSTAVTPNPSQIESIHKHNSLNKLINNKLSANSHTHDIKHKVTTIYQSTTEINSEENDSTENSDEEITENDDESESAEEESDEKVSSVNQKIEHNLIKKKYNYTVSLQKQPVKSQINKNENKDEEDDLISEVLSDEDDESDEYDNRPSRVPSKKPINKNKIKHDESENNDNEEGNSNNSQNSHTEIKPTKLSIKKKPPKKNENKDEDDDDILEVLEEDDEDDEGDDEDEEENDDDDEDSYDDDEEKNKKKKVPQNPQHPHPITESVTQTSIKIKRPTVQILSQNAENKKPESSTEKYFIYNEAQIPEKVIVYNKPIEKVTEKVIMYTEPAEKVTEKVVVYHQPDNTATEKVFIYKGPENIINTQVPQKVIFYKEPTETVTEKYVIYKEPMTQHAVQKVTQQIMGEPGIIISNQGPHKYEVNSDGFKLGEKESYNDEEDSSEEESYETDEKHTLMASIIKPGFSNKYSEEHDLTDGEDLDIEDSEDEGNNFEEDRKLKQKIKKGAVKSSNTKHSVNNNNPKVSSLSELIGQRKKYYGQQENKVISSSRTHRRMNLDRLVNL